MIKDSWILTASGVRFELFDPKPEMVNINDIAHALGNLCRFSGHTRAFYSVAQHSVIVSEGVPREQALTALLHDATETYVGDLVSPLKRHMPTYRTVEARIWQAIQERFGLGEITPEIKRADMRALMTEKRDLMPWTGEDWGAEYQGIEPFREMIEPWGPVDATTVFLHEFHMLDSRAVAL